MQAAYAGAGTILEYGSGGSTVLAAGMAGKRVFSVESDRKWLRRMKEWFAGNPPLADVQLHWADIGPTKRWGVPKDEGGWRNFADYPLSVWDRPDFVQPDVVLIDGRFRVGCFLATIFRLARPAMVLFDDYRPRRAYRAVEAFFAPVEVIGRMARFQVTPVRLEAADLRTVMALMQDPA